MIYYISNSRVIECQKTSSESPASDVGYTAVNVIIEGKAITLMKIIYTVQTRL